MQANADAHIDPSQAAAVDFGAAILQQEATFGRAVLLLNGYLHRGERRDNPSSRIERSERVIEVSPSN